MSLLINQTQRAGNEIALHLKSTTGQRDGIGTTVTLDLGDQNITTQLTAGDGYMCSSERRLVIGTGDLTETGDIQVRWASGKEEQFRGVVCGADYVLVEGSSEAFRLDGPKHLRMKDSETMPSTLTDKNSKAHLAAQKADPERE